MNDFYNVEYMSERVAALAKERDELKKLLKDRAEVVRCDDCKHKGTDSWCEPVENIDGFYCARGERRDA